ncbi:MAG: PfaD family polyunsaturated fatty acid/polyketide biosynthesis protein, partial [Bacteroidota bacterium]
MTDVNNQISYVPFASTTVRMWQGGANQLSFDAAGIQAKLNDVTRPCYVVGSANSQIGVAQGGQMEETHNGQALTVLGTAPALVAEQLGDPAFKAQHGLTYAYSTGAMANGIASEELVIAVGKAGMLGSFGAAGLVPSRVEEAIHNIQAALPNGPYAFNLIHSPAEPALEKGAVDLYLKYAVRTVEASAFLRLTPHIVRYRVNGLMRGPQGEVVIQNKVLAKISRREVAIQFMRPAPEKMLADLVAQGQITADQAEMARQVPMADDITVEADSGGHTDNRPLVCLLPSIVALRDEVQAEYKYAQPVRVGAAGGISTPESALAAFSMGAAYIVTGSVNQACLESGTCDHVRKLLANAGMADIMMAPASDMFEMGVKLQVLKRGTMFPMRAQKLYDFYSNYNSWEEIPQAQREKLEKSTFKRSFEEIWQSCIEFFEARDPHQIERAKGDSKRKMALVFRWYLGLSSNWANAGMTGREADYQIWCGPSMGAFNDWVKGSYLEVPQNRFAADVGRQILRGAAFQYRIQALQNQG